MLRDDARPGEDRHEVGVAVPSGDDVEVDMRLDPGPGFPALGVRLVGDPDRAERALRGPH